MFERRPACSSRMRSFSARTDALYSSLRSGLSRLPTTPTAREASCTCTTEPV
jgi:hypothetical protein